MPKVTRSNPKDGSSGADSNDEVNELSTSGTAGEEASDSSPAMTLEMLKLQLEIEKVKLAQIQSMNERSRGETGKLGDFAKELRAVLAPMPDSDILAPAWFKSAETMMANCETPEEVRGAIILPFLNEKTRAMVATRANGRVL